MEGLIELKQKVQIFEGDLMSGIKKKIRKGFSLVLVCLLMVFQLAAIVSVPAMVVEAAGIEENDNVKLEVSIAGNSTGIIHKGEIFELVAVLKNNTDKEIKDVSLHIASVEGLVPTGSDWNIITGENLASGSNYTFKKINMVYNGSEDSIQLNLVSKFKIGDVEQRSTAVNKFIGVYSEPPANNIPGGTSKYKPELKVKTGIQMPVFNASDDVVLILPISNESSTEAKEIIVSIDTNDVNGLPFTFEQVNLSYKLDNLASNKEKNATFNVTIKPDISGGIYPVKLNYQYKNSSKDTFTASETIYIKVMNDKIPPKITLERFSIYSNDGENPLPGSMLSLTLQLKNQGNFAAKDIKVLLKGLSNEGIYVTKSADTKYIASIDGQKTQNVEYFLYVSDKFKGNNVSLYANIEYKDNSGKLYTEEHQFFIGVEEKDEKKEENFPELTLKNLVFPRDTIIAGEDFNISFSLDNIGTDTARNVKVSITCEDGILPISNSTTFVDAIDKGQTKDLSFNLYANKTAVTKNHSITITVDYEGEKDDKIEKLTFNRYTGVYVEKSAEDAEKETKTVPKIIINKYNFEPEEAKAGENFKLKLSFLNTSKVVPIRNVKITFSAKDGIFIPTNSSNTFFIENMDIQGIAEREVELFTKADAPAKSHVLNLNFEYEDEKGNQYTAAEEISIPVKQEQRLSIGQLNMPLDTMEGQPIPIFMDFFNMGKSTLYNMMVSIESEGLKSDNSNYFVGNFEPGRSDYFENMVTPTATGEVTGNILFSFEDESGKKNEIRKEIKLNVNKMEMPEIPQEGIPGEKFPEGEMPGEGQQKNLFTPLNIGIGVGGLLLIAVIIIIIVKKRRSRKAGMMFDE